MDLRGKLGSVVKGEDEGGERVRVETEKIRRREKSLVVSRFEVIVGSVDSVRKKGRLGGQRREGDAAQEDTAPVLVVPYSPALSRTSSSAPSTVQQLPPVHDISPPPPVHEREPVPEPTPAEIPAQPAPEYQYPPHNPYQDAPDEKTRARMAEEALLPSAPPGVEETVPEASAPDLAHEAELAPMYERGSYSGSGGR